MAYWEAWTIQWAFSPAELCGLVKALAQASGQERSRDTCS
jgi:hypothetical protein